MSGNLIDANTALQYGLVNHVVAPEELINKATTILKTIQSKAPIAVAHCIVCANAVFDETINGYEQEVNSFGTCYNTSDRVEGTQAFLEKRKPVFTGK
jgi:enoyl-CoA hydratase